MVYDPLGRVTTTTTEDGTETHTSDTAAHGIRKLASVAMTSAPTINYGYDAQSRLVSKSWDATSWLGRAITFGFSFDAYNRPSTVTYPAVPGKPDPLVVQNVYGPRGQVVSVGDAAGGTPYWSYVDSDASDAFRTERLRNGVETQSSEDPAHPGWLSTMEEPPRRDVAPVVPLHVGWSSPSAWAGGGWAERQRVVRL